jgi:hypothetical protein
MMAPVGPAEELPGRARVQGQPACTPRSASAGQFDEILLAVLDAQAELDPDAPCPGVLDHDLGDGQEQFWLGHEGEPLPPLLTLRTEQPQLRSVREAVLQEQRHERVQRSTVRAEELDHKGLSPVAR